MDHLRILDASLEDHVDLLKMVLLYNEEMSLLPELYEIFGRDSLLKFLDLFSGTTIKVPSATQIEKALREVTVYLRLKGVTGPNHASRIRELERQFGLTRGEIRVIVAKVKSVLEGQAMVKQSLKKLSRKHGEEKGKKGS